MSSAGDLVRKLSFRRRSSKASDAGSSHEPPKKVAPAHLFNPPPGRTTINGKLRLPASADKSGEPSEFLLQLQKGQAQQSALRIHLQPAEAGCPACFYLVPANEAPEGSPSASSADARLDIDMDDADEQRAPSDSGSLKSFVSGVSSSACSYFTACSSPSSGSNTRDNTLDFSRASTLDLSSVGGSAPSTVDLSQHMQLPSAGVGAGGDGGATCCALTELALRLSPRMLAGGGIDIEGGGVDVEGAGACQLPAAQIAATAPSAGGAVPAAAASAAAARLRGQRSGARLLCDVKHGGTSQFVMCDDPRNEYGVPRELGAVLMRGALLRVIIPRVHVDRTVAQFPVRAQADSILARYQQGEDLRHMMMLDGTILEGRLTLKSLDTGLLVLDITREPEADGTPALALKYTAPLSAYQALCVALSMLCAAPPSHPAATGPPLWPSQGQAMMRVSVQPT